MDFQNVILKVAQLFILIFIGYGAIGLKWLKPEAMKHISNLLFYLCIPSLIMYSLTHSESVDRSMIGSLALASIVLYLVQIIFAFVVPKLLRVEENYRGLYGFFLIFSNAGFIGYPVTRSILGDDAVFYAIFYNIPFNVLVYTLGIYLITKDNNADSKIEPKRFINPGVIAAAIGLTMFFLDVRFPALIESTLYDLSNLAIPLSLLVIGGSLYGVKIGSVLRKKMLFVFTFIRLVFIPFTIMIVMILMKVPPVIGAAAVIIGGMPMGANTVILSQEFDGHIVEASEAVFLSTLLLIISVPILVIITGLML